MLFLIALLLFLFLFFLLFFFLLIAFLFLRFLFGFLFLLLKVLNGLKPLQDHAKLATALLRSFLCLINKFFHAQFLVLLFPFDASDYYLILFDDVFEIVEEDAYELEF